MSHGFESRSGRQMPRRIPTHRPPGADEARAESRRQYDRDRGGEARIRSSARWRKVRGLVLARSPICVDPLGMHQGRVIVADQVHHIEPLCRRPDLAFEVDNLAPLCTQCHAAIEGRERRGVDTRGLFEDMRRRGF